MCQALRSRNPAQAASVQSTSLRIDVPRPSEEVKQPRFTHSIGSLAITVLLLLGIFRSASSSIRLGRRHLVSDLVSEIGTKDLVGNHSMQSPTKVR